MSRFRFDAVFLEGAANTVALVDGRGPPWYMLILASVPAILDICFG